MVIATAYIPAPLLNADLLSCATTPSTSSILTTTFNSQLYSPSYPEAMAQYRAGQRRALLDLPVEILTKIVNYLPVDNEWKDSQRNHTTTAQFRATCKEAFHLCERLWWNSCLISSRRQSCDAFSNSLGAHQYRYDYVEKLRVSLDNRHNISVVQQTAGFISRLPNLKTLSLRATFSMDDWISRETSALWQDVLASQLRVSQL